MSKTRAEASVRRTTGRLPGIKLLPAGMRRQLRRQVLAVLSHDGPAPDYDAPKGDAGLFGPDSITWKIHADFPSMMAGGLASLMLQMLHPLAMAGVWDHSSFQHDILGRLRRTTAFVGRTTYAPSAPAEAIIEHVRRVHLHVVGTALDGRPYRADDPHLLTWVQCAEAWCFLKAYRAYCHADIPVPLQDRYLAEFARVAEALGARDVPKTLADLTAFFDAERAQLVFDERCATVLRTLDSIDLPIPLAGLGRRMFLGAAASLLPDWALDLMQRPPRERMRDHVGAASLKLMAPSIRDAMAEGGLAWRACRRTDADYAGLFRWPKDAP